MNIQSIGTSLPAMMSSAEVGNVAREAKVADIPVRQEGQSAQPETVEQLKKAIDSVQQYIEPFNSDLEFSVNDKTDRLIVTVIDSETKEVIRQIPSKEMLAIAEALDSIKGLFVKQQA